MTELDAIADAIGRVVVRRLAMGVVEIELQAENAGALLEGDCSCFRCGTTWIERQS